jgi:hypothetical protein
MTGDQEKALDPGIRQTVKWLQDNGFVTTDSGDGVSKTEAIATGEALGFPHVFMMCSPDTLFVEAHRLYDLLRGKNLTSPQVEASYSPADGIALLLLTGLDDTLLERTG